ncbi:transposase, partial [Paraburkholderia fungorum]
NSLLGKALTYLREQWPKLILYVENGNWPISNNACENSIRPFVIGRRYRHIVVIGDSSPACGQ